MAPKLELEASTLEYQKKCQAEIPWRHQADVNEYDQEIQRLDAKIEAYALDAIYASTRIQDLEVELQVLREAAQAEVQSLEQALDILGDTLVEIDEELNDVLEEAAWRENVLRLISEYRGNNVSVPVGLATTTLDGFDIRVENIDAF